MLNWFTTSKNVASFTRRRPSVESWLHWSSIGTKDIPWDFEGGRDKVRLCTLFVSQLFCTKIIGNEKLLQQMQRIFCKGLLWLRDCSKQGVVHILRNRVERGGLSKWLQNYIGVVRQMITVLHDPQEGPEADVNSCRSWLEPKEMLWNCWIRFSSNYVSHLWYDRAKY